jgi:hypothetical protein
MKLTYCVGLATTLLLVSASNAQVQLGRFAGLWCPRHAVRTVYAVTDELQEVEEMSFLTEMSNGQITVTAEFKGLDSHKIRQRFLQASPNAKPQLIQVAAWEQNGSPHPLTRGSFFGGGAPIAIQTLAESDGKRKWKLINGQILEGEHYQLGDGEVLISDKAPPYGLVRFHTPGLTLNLKAIETVKPVSKKT